MPRKPVLLVALYSPEGETELLLLRSVFEGSGIDFFITNDTFGAMTAAPRAALYNRRTLLVAEDQLDEARGLLEEFLRRVRLELVPGERVAAPPKARRETGRPPLRLIRGERPQDS